MTVPLRRSRPYLFWGQTTSLCETCLGLVPAKIEIRDNEVWYRKRCPQHGTHTTLVSTDAAYWKLCKDTSSQATARCRCRAAPITAVPTIADCAPTMSSIPAWR